MNRAKAAFEWVMTATVLDRNEDFYEAGGVYQGKKPSTPECDYTRKLEHDERVASCPRCGQRFATTEESTADECRDLHFAGDDDIPSICADMPLFPDEQEKA